MANIKFDIKMSKAQRERNAANFDSFNRAFFGRPIKPADLKVPSSSKNVHILQDEPDLSLKPRYMEIFSTHVRSIKDLNASIRLCDFVKQTGIAKECARNYLNHITRLGFAKESRVKNYATYTLNFDQINISPLKREIECHKHQYKGAEA